MTLVRFLVAHSLRPIIVCVYELDAVASAYQRAREGAFGKVVIRL